MYAKIVANAIAQYPANPRADHPDVSIGGGWTGGTVAGDDYVTVASTARPAHDAAAQNVVEITPVKVGATWTQQWSVVAASAEEIAARADAAQGAADQSALKAQAAQAVDAINTFLAIASPTNAQVVAEVKAIDVRQRAIIKALARLVAG